MDNVCDLPYDAAECGNGYTSSLLYQKPAETLKWIEQYGVKKLGTFKVRVSTSIVLILTIS